MPTVAVLAEVYPVIAAAVRAQVAAEVRAARSAQAAAFGDSPSPYDAGRLDGLEDAARIAAAPGVAPTEPIDAAVKRSAS